MNHFLSSCTVWAEQNQTNLLYTLIITVVVLAIIHVILWVGARLLQRHFCKKQMIWAQAIFYAMRLPIGFFIWIAGLTYGFLILDDSPIEKFGDHIINLSFIVCFIWFILRMIGFVEDIYCDETYQKSLQQRDTIYTIARFVKIIFIVLGVLIVLQTLGVSVSGLIAFGGIGAAGIAFAAKDMLNNLFGGFMLFVTRPFSVGDWIRSPDRNIEGNVENIGWLLTRIRTFERRPLYVPNGIFSTIIIENPQRMLNRRIQQTVALRFDDVSKVTEITVAIRAMLKNHPELDASQTTYVDLINFGSSSLNIFINAYTKTIDTVKFQDVQQDVLLQIMAIIAQHGAQCAFPTQTAYNISVN